MSQLDRQIELTRNANAMSGLHFVADKRDRQQKRREGPEAEMTYSILSTGFRGASKPTFITRLQASSAAHNSTKPAPTRRGVKHPIVG